MDDRYRRKRDRLVECAGDAARMPTKWGPFQAYCYRSILDGIEHIAMVKVTTFVHSAKLCKSICYYWCYYI